MTAGWKGIDEGWGRRAVDFTTPSEPANCREYVALHHKLRIDDGDRLLDVARGARTRGPTGAVCAGIDQPFSLPRSQTELKLVSS